MAQNYFAQKEQETSNYFAQKEKSSTEVIDEPKSVGRVKADLYLEGFKAAPEIALTTFTSGLAEIASGWAGIFRLPFGVDKAVERVQKTSEKGTYQPRGEGAQKALQTIAPALAKIEEGADYIAEKGSRGNPIAATIIKTTLLGGLELAPPFKGTKNAAKAGKIIRGREKEVRRIASEHGINLDLKSFSDDLVDAAKRLTPDERAQNAPALVQALQKAKKSDFNARKAKYDAARQSRTYIETSAAKDLSDAIFADLVTEGYDLAGMPGVARMLDEMASLDTRIPGIPGARGQRPTPVSGVNLNQLEIFRKRTQNLGAFGTPESKVGSVIRNHIDDFLDNEFNKAAIEAGKIKRGDGAIFGDPAGVQRWKSARRAHKSYVERYKADKVISQLIEQESTPEQYRQWLLGASAINAKKEAALTIKRMKQILGDDHRAIEGIRQDFLFEMYEPLLKETPNFRQFVNNYDTMVRRNPNLVRELGLDQTAIKDMHDFAKAQAKLPPSGRIFSRGDIIGGVTRMAVGHQIAKAAVRVEFSRRLANAVAGVDAVSPKQIISDIMDVRFDEVAIPRSGPLAAEFFAGAAITGLAEDEE